MGLSFSLLSSAWEEIVNHSYLNWSFNIILTPKNGALTLRTNSFKKTELKVSPLSNSSSESTTTHNVSSRLRDLKPEKMTLRRNLSFTDLVQEKEITGSNAVTPKDQWNQKTVPKLHLPETAVFSSPRPISELDAAATKVQKVYKSYRTRRNLADCAVVVEELWWKALDFAELKRNSVSFFDIHKSETAVSRWARAKNRVAKVGKGLSKDENAQKLALRHWLEAIDPRHRYGHNLHMYYDIWFESQSTQPFFYWLDIGDGKEVNLEKCPRSTLHRQCIQYLGPKEREAFEVIVEDGKLVYRKSGSLVETTEGSKWIFVLSTTRALYVGQKKKGSFQHSSFLAGGATTAAGRLVAHVGILEAIWPYSGHYLPTEENFKEFISFLEDNHVDLSNVKRCAYDDEYPSFKVNDEEAKPQEITGPDEASKPHHTSVPEADENDKETTQTTVVDEQENVKVDDVNFQGGVYSLARRLSCKWTTGTGPRIGCVRDYPVDLQSRALEQVNLSPRRTPGRLPCYGPIPSPRPSPKVRVSPRLAYMGVPSPRSTLAFAN